MSFRGSLRQNFFFFLKKIHNCSISSFKSTTAIFVNTHNTVLRVIRVISRISLSSDSHDGCMQILSKDGEMEEGRRCVGRRGGLPHVIWIPVFFLPLLFSFPHPELFFFSPFWLRRRIIGTPSLPPPPGQAAQGFRQIYFSKHLWTLGGK